MKVLRASYKQRRNFCALQHSGCLGGWEGSGERILLTGKNKLEDIFEGSTDSNILVLADYANGDALFVDDIYTAFGKDAARLAQIDEIRAGAGNDIVDMTSQQFAYVGSGATIYGGSGDDTIWANVGNNTLFGDAGNDRIIGGANNDVIVGGSGNDSLHGGGGDDIFCFGGDWGNDTIEQLAGGSVTLWIEKGSESSWDADTLTYTDGANSVTVSGVTNITLRFGADTSLPAGCFADAENALTGESGVEVSRNGREVCKTGEMILTVQHRLIQMGDAPTLRDVEGKQL